MDNKQIARVFEDVSRLLEVRQDSPFKIRAYHTAARAIGTHAEELRDIVARGGDPREIPGIGDAIASKVLELLSSGKLQYLDELRGSMPAGVLELMEVPGIGPRTARRLAGELGIASVEDLEAALRSGAVSHLSGIGEKKARTLLREIETHRRRDTRIPIGAALPVVERILARLQTVPGVAQVSAAGSVRRFVEMVGDVDLLAVSESPADATRQFVQLEMVDRVLAHGPTRVSIVTDDGLQVDLRIVEPDSYGSALQYFTGSEDHNVALREHALSSGLSVSEYGITVAESGEIERFDSEEALYRRLGLQFIPPELRENQGEIQLAARDALPRLVTASDLRGDLHVHSNWSDGVASIEELAAAAVRRNYEYIAITDHSWGLGVAHGLDARRIREQGEVIRRVNEVIDGCTVLHGVEVNIKSDGSLDLPPEVLADLDLVVAAVHSALGQDRERMTSRIVRALENPYVHVLAHPTGRLLSERAPCDVDMGKVFEAAARTGTLLELNAMPDRLDLSAAHVRAVHGQDVLLSIGTDTHCVRDLQYLGVYGIGIARRGWCEPQHIANTMSLVDLRACLKHRCQV